MGYKHFGWRSDQPTIRGKRGPYRKRIRLATGPLALNKNGEYRTFEEFCVEQELRLQQQLFRQTAEQDAQRERTAMARNSGRLLLRDMNYEGRGLTNGAVGHAKNTEDDDNTLWAWETHR